MDHVILDEYQDINESQQQLVKAIGGQRARVMAVGDVGQCAYAVIQVRARTTVSIPSTTSKS